MGINKKWLTSGSRTAIYIHFIVQPYTLCLGSSDTDNFFLPLTRRADIILRPLAEVMRDRNPCLFFLFLLEGWNVLFIRSSF